MMEDISINREAVNFLLFVISGMLSGMLYELIRLIRYECKPDVSELLFDIISSVSLFGFVLYSFIKINNLDIKFNCISGMFLGVVLYFTAFSSLVRKIMGILLKIFKKILKILLYPAIISCIIIKKILYYLGIMCSFPWKFIKKQASKIINSFNKAFRRLRKI